MYILKSAEIVGFKQRIHLDTIISLQMKPSLSYYLYLVSTRIDKYVYCIYTYILYIYTTYLYIGKDNSVSIFQPILQLLHSISTPTMLIDSSTQTQS